MRQLGHGTTRSLWTAILAVVLVVPLGLVAGALPALADEGDPEYLQIDKSISESELSAGDQFTYTIQVTCSESNCVNASISDAFPPELEGFPITNVTLTPAAGVVPREVTWLPGGTEDAPAAFGTDTELHVDLQQPFPGGTGLGTGTTFTITVTSQVPADHPPSIVEFTNVARTTADNAQPVADSVDATIIVPRELGVAVSKTWLPESSAWAPGAESVIDLGVTNTSNGPVQTLVLQEPQTAEDGSAALDAGNPFVLHDFAGFASTALPEGCENVQVDAYVLADTTWSWVEGTPAASAALPAGVTNADVGGLRITCTGASIAQGAAGSFSLDLTQRELDRNTGQSFETEPRTTDNTAAGEARVPGRDPATDTASASHSIVPTAVVAAAAKDITPSRIPAGDTATATITGTNASDGGVHELRVSDLDYFTEDVTFGGFEGAPTWPADAVTGQVIYHPLDGDASVTIDLVPGQIPTAPTGPISGFELVFTADGDGIAAGASGSASFTIETDPTMAEEAAVPTSNEITATVTTESGRPASGDDSDDLTIVTPQIVVELDKAVLPSSAVEPGEDVVTSLTATTAAESEFVNPTEIVVEDSWGGGADEFWNAFNPTGIAPTQILPNTSLEIEVQLPDGSWAQVALHGLEPGPRTVSMSEAELAAALPDGVGLDQLTGIRFTFTSDGTFPSGTTVRPNLVSEARGELRSGGPSTPGPDQPVVYTNTATTTGTGVTPGGQTITGEDDDTGQATIETETGAGPVGIDKEWDNAFVDAQSSQQRTTTLSWEVDEGFETVTMTDPAAPEAADSPEETVFQAFDLVAINPINPSDVPFSNGWWLTYDTISEIQLYNGSSWVSIPEPAGGWITSSGRFVGYQLSGPQQDSTIGVRLVLEENTTAREEAYASGSDPFAPRPGSGVGASSSPRTFGLTWQVRDSSRVGGEFVTGDDLYNTADQGIVDNTVGLEGTDPDGGTATDVDNDTIRILDQPPAVDVEKSVTPDELLIPPADSPAGSYPTAEFVITGNNESTSRASYVRLTDPAPCEDGTLNECATANTAAGAGADPFAGITSWDDFGTVANPFDRFDIESVTFAASISEEVDLAATRVWLLRYSDGAFSSTPTTAAAVNAGGIDLSDVVGISVAFQGSNPATSGGTLTSENDLTISIDARVRGTIRSTGAVQALDPNQTVDVTNRTFAQSYDPITADADVVARDNAQDGTVLSGGTIAVGASKSVDPAELLEPTRDAPVTVTLGADSGSSTLSPVTVTLEDQAASPDFWNAFDLTGIGTITAPAGADRVQVDLYGPFGPGGELGWADGTPSDPADPTLPVDDDALGDVQGIRVTFSTAAGGLFSDQLPAPAWTTAVELTVQLRDDYRDDSGPIPMTGTVTNTLTTQSNGALASSDEATADTQIELGEGSHELSINKLANGGTHYVSPGVPAPFRLQIQNSGSGYLTLTELRDQLPEQLLYPGETVPVYTAEPGGMLSEDVTLTQDGQVLTFTWPEGGNVMAPGETFEIVIELELQPVSGGTQVTNTIVAQTQQELDSCSNIVDGGPTTTDWANEPSTCGTTDYVEPAPGPNLFTVKGVRGELDGAINPVDPDAGCRTITSPESGMYYRAPCAANSVVGGTDDWLLYVANAGTTAVESMTIFDQLPIAGDQRLVDGNPRDSQYAPEVVANSLDLVVPDGTTYTLEVSESDDVCAGTWPTVQTEPACEQNGEVWVQVEPGADIDWTSVRGIRVRLDFTTTAAGALQPGERVELTLSTVNSPISVARPESADTAVPADDQLAWNQFGVRYHSRGETENRKIAPAVVGVHLLYGPIEIEKVVDGPAAGYAAAAFDVDVACAIEGSDIDMGEHASVTISEQNDFTYRIDGIPVGAECTVTEHGEVGAYGETAREGSPTTVPVTVAALADEDVPAAQVVAITNVYEASGLSVTKRVDTRAGVGEFGPFTFTLTCESATGVAVTFDDDGETELAFTLAADETYSAPADRIPVGATCTLTETDAAAANGTVILGDNVTDNGDGSATVVPGVTPAQVEVTNAFDAGVLEIVKVVDGAGAERYGSGSFTFDVVCTWQGDVVLEESYDLDANATRTVGPLPVDTSCVVTETATGGATSSVLSPAGEVVIEAPGDDEDVSTVTVTATNTFDVAALEVTKEIAGDTTVAGADGTFTVHLECTRLVDGTQQDVAIPGGAERRLTADETVTFADLPVGADCALMETVDGDAASTTIEVAGATTEGTAAEVALTDVGGAHATVTNTFEADPVPTPDPDNPTDPDEPTIPVTGADIGGYVTLAALLVLLGSLAVIVRRKRHLG